MNTNKSFNVDDVFVPRRVPTAAEKETYFRLKQQLYPGSKFFNKKGLTIVLKEDDGINVKFYSVCESHRPRKGETKQMNYYDFLFFLVDNEFY